MSEMTPEHEAILFPGTRVKVFDHRLFKDDRSTPLSVTMRPATVVRWYGTPAYASSFGPYENLIDIIFDGDEPAESRAHIVSPAIEILS